MHHQPTPHTLQFNVLNTHATYTALLNAPDDASRMAIFEREIVAPFDGLTRAFGPGGGAAFKMWGMWPEQFAGPAGDAMRERLGRLTAADAWARLGRALQDADAAFTPAAARLDLPPITVGLLLGDFSGSPSDDDYTGFGGFPGYVMTIYSNPNAANLGPNKLEAITVHELHHNILSHVQPHNMATFTVGEYMVMEGLAEAFAAELYGEDALGPWVFSVSDAEFEVVRRRFAPALQKAGFDSVRAYIFGDDIAARMGITPVGVPATAGYSVGYRTVRAYLAATGQTVAEATFEPAQAIIRGSGLFPGHDT